MSEARTLPHSLQAEKAVLGSVLITPAGLDKTGLRPAHFFRDAHIRIYKALLRLAETRDDGIDLLTLTEELRRTGEIDEVGGPAYLSALTDGIPRSANVGHYAGIVREKAELRAVIRTANEMLVSAYDAESKARDVITQADIKILELQRTGGAGNMVDLRESSLSLYADLEWRVEHKGELTGVETGFHSINELTFGWQKQEMIIIAARPSIGKTAFVLNTAIAGANDDNSVAIFSLEMRRKQLEYRLLSSLSGVPLSRILGGFLGEEDLRRLSEAMVTLGRLEIRIDDRSGQTVSDIRSSCRRIKAESGLDLVVIDYVQLMSGETERRGATRQEELADISRRLKVMAGEIDVPLLLLSQLKRGDERRPDKEPKLEDLRESGALEQDADVVGFLHRKDHRVSGTTSFIFGKQRNGPTGTVNLTIDRDTQTFTDGGHEPEPEPPAPKAADDEDEAPKPPKGYRRGKRGKH